MSYDPNLNRDPEPNRPPVGQPAGTSWVPWVVVGAVVVVGLVVWSMSSGPAVDPATTSSTTPPAVTDTAPVKPVEPMAPTTDGTPPAEAQQ